MARRKVSEFPSGNTTEGANVLGNQGSPRVTRKLPIGTAAYKTAGGAAGNVPVLDSGGHVAKADGGLGEAIPTTSNRYFGTNAAGQAGFHELTGDFKGVWSSSATYAAGDLVVADANDGARFYSSKVNNNSSALTDNTKWQPLGASSTSVGASDLNTADAASANAVLVVQSDGSTLDFAKIAAGNIDAGDAAQGDVLKVGENSALSYGPVGDANIGVGSLNFDRLKIGGTKATGKIPKVVTGGGVEWADDATGGQGGNVTIPDGSVTRAKLAPDVIDGTRIADDAIGSEHINTAAVNHDALANDCIDGDNVQNASLGSEHYKENSVDSNAIKDAAVGTTQLANAGVTGPKLAADAVSAGSKVADNVIDSEHIVSGALDSRHYAAGSVDNAALASSSVQGGQIATGAVIRTAIAAGAIDNSRVSDTANIAIGKLNIGGTQATGKIIKATTATEAEWADETAGAAATQWTAWATSNTSITSATWPHSSIHTLTRFAVDQRVTGGSSTAISIAAGELVAVGTALTGLPSNTRSALAYIRGTARFLFALDTSGALKHYKLGNNGWGEITTGNDLRSNALTTPQDGDWWALTATASNRPGGAGTWIARRANGALEAVSLGYTGTTFSGIYNKRQATLESVPIYEGVPPPNGTRADIALISGYRFSQFDRLTLLTSGSDGSDFYAAPYVFDLRPRFIHKRTGSTQGDASYRFYIPRFPQFSGDQFFEISTDSTFRISNFRDLEAIFGERFI